MTLISKNFSEVITFSRGTGATRVNSAGLIVGVDFSVTSNTIATGSKTFTLAADANVNRDWPVGSNVIAVAQAGATGSMTGTVTSYTPSTQSLVINVVSVTGSGTSTDWRIGSLEMREDYDPVTLVRRGVLSEVAATNTSLGSDDLSGYTGTAVTETPNFSLSPSGSNNARRLQGTGATSVYQRAASIVSGRVYTISVYAKAANAGVNATFRLLGDGNMSSADMTATATFVRYKYTFTAVTGGSRQHGLVRPTNNADWDIVVFGFCVEEATDATSYIPTTTAQVTRNADSFPLTSAALTSIRQGESTLYAEIDCPDTGVAQKRALRLSGVNADIRIGKQGTGTLSNFTKMSEGAGLRLMGTSAGRGLLNDGLESAPFTYKEITGAILNINDFSSVAFNGGNIYGLSIGQSAAINDVTLQERSIVAAQGGRGFNGVHWNGSRFIIASSSANVVTLSDGNSWRVVRNTSEVITQPTNEVTSGLVGATLRNVIVGNGGFIATSDDNGETWTSRTSGTTLSINAITHTGTRFVAQTTGGVRPVIYSDNGINWTTGQSNLGSGDIHFAAGVVVSAGINGNIFVSSDNGVTFVAATNTNTTQLLNGVSYSPTLNLWIAVGNAGTIITATDPAGTWTVQTSGTTQGLNKVGIFNNAIYVVGNTQTLLTSTNGTSYTSLNAGVTANLFGIAASPTTLLITGSSGAMVSSTDGTTFTSRTNNNATLNGIAFGNNTFVSVGNEVNGSGYIATIAADGTVTRRVSGTTAGISNVKFGAGAYYAVSGAQVGRSTDGVSWVFQTLGANAHYSMAIDQANNRVYYLRQNTALNVTDLNNVFVSGPNIGFAPTFGDIEIANGVIVIVGSGGNISTSTNGTTWTLRTSNTTANLNSVMFSQRDQLWYAAGNGGVLLYSPDAITWTAVQNSGTASILGTTLQSNQPLPQFKNGVNKIALSYKANQVISALNGVASTTDTTATIPSITAGTIGENFNGTIQKIEVLDSALTTSEIIEKTL